MKDFLKKSAIAVCCGLFVVAIFWKSLVTTAFWGSAVFVTWGNSAAEPILQPDILLGYATTSSSTQVGTLGIPHVFASTSVMYENDYIAVFRNLKGNEYFLVSPLPAFVATFVRNHSTEECELYSNVLPTNPCRSDIAFISALVATSTHNTHLFSRAHKKLTDANFRTLRTSYLPEQTVSITPIHSFYITGHVSNAANKSVAFVTDIGGNSYELTFVNMTPQEIQQTLSAVSTPTL